MSLYTGQNSSSSNKIFHVTSGTNQEISYLNNNIKNDTLLHSSMPYVSVLNTELITSTGVNNDPAFYFNTTTSSYFSNPNVSYMYVFGFPDGSFTFSPKSAFFTRPDLVNNVLKGFAYIGTEPTKLFIIQFSYNVFNSTSSRDIIINNSDIIIDGISLLAKNPMYITSTSTPVNSQYDVVLAGAMYIQTPKNNTVFSAGSLELTSSSAKLYGTMAGQQHLILDNLVKRPTMNVSYSSYTKADFNNTSNLYFNKVIGNDFSYIILIIEGIDNARPDPYNNYTGASFFMNAVLPANGDYVVELLLDTVGYEKDLYIHHRSDAVSPNQAGTLTINMFPADPNAVLDILNVKMIKVL